MFWAPLAISAVAGIGNYFANKNANDRAMAIQSDALRAWMDLNIPDPEEQKIALEKFVSEGELTPVLQEAIAQDPSAFQQIVTDHSHKSAQNKALSEMQDIGHGGLRLQDKAALQEAMLEGQTQERGNRLAIEQEMARRGQRGSGVELASRLQSQQGQTDRNARNSLSVAAQAQDRALQAIMGAGDLATKYRGQDFSEQAQKASAQDAISRFNTQNMRDVNAANTAYQNHANEYNLGNKQRLADMNTSQNNQQQIYNKQLSQQFYQNQKDKLAGAYGYQNAQSNLALNAGKNLGNFYTNIGKSGSAAATNYATADFWDNYFDKEKSYKSSKSVNKSLDKVHGWDEYNEDDY